LLGNERVFLFNYFYLIIFINNFRPKQIGDGTVISKLFPVSVVNSDVLSGKKIVQISSGGYHTCSIASDGNSYCWGSNWFKKKIKFL
jgi:hypothetical protein